MLSQVLSENFLVLRALVLGAHAVLPKIGLNAKAYFLK